MKKHKIIMVAVLVVGITMGVFAAGAGTQVRSGIGIKAGYSMLSEDINEGWRSGLVFGADYLFLINPSYGIDLGVDYFFKENAGVTLTIMPVTGSFIYILGNLYIGGGVGYYHTQTLDVSDVTDPQLALGYHALAGISLGPQIFIEGKYSTAKIEEWGVDVGGISVFGGVRL